MQLVSQKSLTHLQDEPKWRLGFISTLSSVSLALWLIALPAAADEISEIEDNLALVKKKLELAVEQVKLMEQERLKLDKTDKMLALEKSVAAKKTPSKSKKLKINWARIVSVSNESLSCNATPFLAYTCNAAANDKCEFLIDKTICGDPSNEKDAKILRLDYACGPTPMGIVDMNFGFKGYLTCN